MVDLSQEELLSAIEKAVDKAVRDNLSQFYIERERHYKDHTLVTKVRIRLEKVASTSCNVFVYIIVMGLVTLLGFGVKECVTRLLK